MSAVNVFLGLGLPWLIAAIYWKGEGFSEEWAVKVGSDIARYGGLLRSKSNIFAATIPMVPLWYLLVSWVSAWSSSHCVHWSVCAAVGFQTQSCLAVRHCFASSPKGDSWRRARRWNATGAWLSALCASDDVNDSPPPLCCARSGSSMFCSLHSRRTSTSKSS